MYLSKLTCLFLLLFSFSLAGAYPNANLSLPHINTGNSHAKSGNYPEALASLNAAVAKDPHNARAYKLRGHVHYAMGNYSKALADLDHVVTLVPANANAYADRAIVHSVLGHHGLALADIERARALKPASTFAQAVRTKILERAAE